MGDGDRGLGAIARQLGGTLDVIDTATGVVAEVNGVIGFLADPLELVANVVRPIEPLLNASGLVFKFTVEPILNPIIRATGIERIFNPAIELILELVPEVEGIERLGDALFAVINETIVESLVGFAEE
ncbi:hypothetical protein [Yoonia sp. SS1-5]|uniref:Uncharacterized protein n=1 Tax=Yoonia rhodophyticola TaxID=3137370 RepID=A0ABZ3JCG0_9RHOB